MQTRWIVQAYRTKDEVQTRRDLSDADAQVWRWRFNAMGIPVVVVMKDIAAIRKLVV